MKCKTLVTVLAVSMLWGVAFAETFNNLTINGNSTFKGNVNVINSKPIKLVGGTLTLSNPLDSTERFIFKFNGMRLFRPGGAFFDNEAQGADTVFRTFENSARDHTPLRLRANGDTVIEILEITGGSDLSETFDVTSAGGHVIEPGTVVSIDPTIPGRLMVSYEAYDKKVVGIISGAGGLKTGMIMGQTDSLADGEHPVALTGRVYCKVDATMAAIEPGDLLTTSATPGHAMKVTGNDAPMGSIIGKAMTPLAQGETGLVLVLVGRH